jgi:DNA-binding HxlR family transcriptional regulator
VTLAGAGRDLEGGDHAVARPHAPIRTTPCSLARTLSVVGDRWTLLILRQAFAGTRRFRDFRAQLGLTTHRLAERLRKLVDEGILERRPYQERPLREEYRLTEKGRDLYPVLMAMFRWGDRWMADPEGPPVVFVHQPCGHDAEAAMVCTHCGGRLDARSVRPESGPGLRSRRSAG